MGPYKISFYKSDIVYILFEILILYLFIKFNIFADLLYYRILRLMDKKTLKFIKLNYIALFRGLRVQNTRGLTEIIINYIYVGFYLSFFIILVNFLCYRIF